MIRSRLRIPAGVLAIPMMLAAPSALAQHAGHVMATPPQEAAATTPEQTPASAQDPHAGHGTAEVAPVPTDEGKAGAPAHDHGAMEDHAGMDHAPAREMDPASMQGMVHAGMDHATMNHGLPAQAAPRDLIPALAPADRAAAFPDVAGHAVHDDNIHSMALVDRLEAWDADGGNAIGWEASAWIGTDLDRMWLRSEGEAVDGKTGDANVELFYGRAIARWWDAVVGIRHDFGDGPSQTLAAIGLIGQAPYKFEVEATAYVGQGGQSGLGLEAEYDTLLSNRLILQWRAEAQAWGKDDARRAIGSGLSTIEAGLRLRYEVTRRFAPYVGIARERAFGGTADLRRADGHDIDDTRVVAGVRFWF